MSDEVKKYLAEIGRKGGQAETPAKKAASARNLEKARRKRCDDVWHVREHMWCGSKARGVVRCLNCSKPIPYTQGTCPHCGKTEF